MLDHSDADLLCRAADLGPAGCKAALGCLIRLRSSQTDRKRPLHRRKADIRFSTQSGHSMQPERPDALALNNPNNENEKER